MVSCRSRLWKIPPRTVHACLIEHFSFHGGGSIPCRNKSAEAGVAYLSVTPPLWGQSWDKWVTRIAADFGSGPELLESGSNGISHDPKKLKP